MIIGYACRSKNSDHITIASGSKLPDKKDSTGWFWHVPGSFYTLSIYLFKKKFGFSVKPGTYKLINITISET